MRAFVPVLISTLILGLAAMILYHSKEQKSLTVKDTSSYCNKAGLSYLGQRVKAHREGACKG